MSRKHYIETAAIIKSAREQYGATPALDDIATEMASFFKRDNGRFDRAKFMRACEASA